VRVRVLANLRNVDEALAKRVAKGLAMDLPESSPVAMEPLDMNPSPALSIVLNTKAKLDGRTVGILFAEGSEKPEVERVKRAVENAGARAVLIAPTIGRHTLAGGSLQADGQLAGTPSVTVDAIALVLSEGAASKLAKDAAAVQFVMDAFGHLKTIGASAGAKLLLQKAGVVVDSGVTGLGSDFIAAAATRCFDREQKIRSLA
jgi:catalase